MTYTRRTTDYRQTHGLVMLPFRSIGQTVKARELGQTGGQMDATKCIISPASQSITMY